MADERPKKPITDEIATARKDIDIFSGYLDRLENPDPTLRTEAAGKGLKLYDEVDRDPHAGAVLQSRYLSVIGKQWSIIPADEPSAKGRPNAVTQAQKIADFVQSALRNTNFAQARQELLGAILYGFYVGEVIWALRDGAIVPGKILAKHPRRFMFTQDREMRLLTLSSMIEGEPLPDRKFIRFTYGSSDNPYGKGLGQKLWWPVWFKKNGIRFWLVFLEKFGMPTTVGKYPPGTPPDQQKALLDAVDAIHNETGVKIPDTMAIELLEAARSGRVTYGDLCEYMDKQISKAVLGQTATTEGTPGKLGNEDSQAETKNDIAVADAGLLDECLNETLIRWIVDFNYPGVTAYPKLQTRTDEEKDLKPLADRDMILARDIGVPIGKRYFYEVYNIPEPDEGEEIVSARQQWGTSAGAYPGFSESSDDLSPATALTRMGEKAMAGADMEGLMDPVEKLLAAADSLEDFRDRLLDIYGDMNESDLGTLMQKAMTLADMAGRFDVIER